MKEEIMQFMEDALKDIDPNLSIERIHKIIFSIVSVNFPVCAKKYLAGQDWQLNRQQEEE